MSISKENVSYTTTDNSYTILLNGQPWIGWTEGGFISNPIYKDSKLDIDATAKAHMENVLASIEASEKTK